MQSRLEICAELHLQFLHPPLQGQHHLQRIELRLLDLRDALINFEGLQPRGLDFPAYFQLEKLELTHQPHPILLRLSLQISVHVLLLLSDALDY